MAMIRAGSFALFCVAIAAFSACHATANPAAPPSRDVFPKVVVTTASGTFTYVNVFMDVVHETDGEFLAIHQPRSEALWSISVVRGVESVDMRGRHLNVDLNALAKTSAAEAQLCTAYQDRFGGCPPPQFFSASHPGGCWNSAPCGFAAPGQGLGIGAMVFQNKSGCWIDFATEYLDCTSNFVVKPSLPQAPFDKLTMTR